MGGGPGGLPQRPLREEVRHRGRGSRARRAETPRRDLPDGCHRALPQARDLCRGGYRRDVPGGRLNQEDRGRLRAPLGGAGVHREDGERRVRRDTGLHGIPAGALAPDQDEQRDRTHRPRDQEEDEGRRDLPGRQLGRHTGVSETEVHSGARMGQEEVPGHVQTGGDGRAEGKSGGLEEDEAEDG